ncbi:hypothetical protein ACFL1L_03485 [Thermoplasmatota archaeon]
MLKNEVSKSRKTDYGGLAIQIGTILFLFFVLLIENIKNSGLTIIEYVNHVPIILLFPLILLIAFAYVIIKKKTIRGLGDWMLNNFMKYLMMFTSIIVTTYIVYFVFIIGNPQTWFEWLTTIIIISSVFVIFLWIKYFEEISEKKVDRKKIMPVLKNVGLFMLLLFIFTFCGIGFYSYILNTSKGLTIMGAFQGTIAFSVIFSGMEKELINKARVLIGLIFNGLFLYLILIVEPFRIVLEVTESDSNLTYLWYLLVGSIIILIGFFYGHFTKDDNFIKQIFRQLSKKSI